MDKRRFRQRLRLALMAGSIQWLGFTSPVQAESMSWDSFSRALNNAFTGNIMSRNNLIVLIITLIVVLALMLVFHLYWKREREQILNHSKHISHSPSLPQPPHNVRQQRRKWFRLRTDLLIKWIQSKRSTVVGEAHYRKDHLLDISGGGLSFKTSSFLSEGDDLTFLIDIGGKKPLTLKGRVLRVQEASAYNQEYMVAIQFGDLLTGERDRLVSWIIKGQRAEMQDSEP